MLEFSFSFTDRDACSFRRKGKEKKRREKKKKTNERTNAFLPTVHARKQVYRLFHRVALSFLRDFFPTEKKGNSVGWAWLAFLSFFRVSFDLVGVLELDIRFVWLEVKRNKGRDLNRMSRCEKYHESPPRLALLRFTPAGWTSIARIPLSPLFIRAHRRRCRCDCFVSRFCPSTDRCQDTFGKSSCTSPRSCAKDCTPSDCCTSSAGPIDPKDDKSNGSPLSLFNGYKDIYRRTG